MKVILHDAPTIVVGILFFLIVNFSDAHAQRGPLPTWRALAEESSAVVVADVVEAQLNIIDSAEERKVETTADGKFTLGNPALYTVGILSRVRVERMLKSDGKIRTGDTIAVFVPGYNGLDTPHIPMDKEKLVIFVRLLEPSKTELRATVIERIERTEQAGHPRYKAQRERFDSKGCYTPVEDGYAQVLVPPDKLDIIDKIQEAINNPPLK